ncbi:protease-associated domain-containing protein 1 [Pundamilia nyererei]|uniref:Protease-associated domain-containing protein 1 n=1 Tax=Pundamilia nyererei TaxID=303518 RepID=A0A9Y3RFM7_9CICH|nr:PREDICTED: protease-associated domain-containing protein 1 [Pundamilia nyererei]
MGNVCRTAAIALYLWGLFMQFSRLSALGVNELLYFRVISPEEIGYLFSAAPAKDFGGTFTSFYDEIFLVPADPADGCSELTDREILQGQVILVERGYAYMPLYHFDMVTDGSTAKPSIPALFLLGRDGMMIRRSLQRQALPWAVISIPVNVSALASFPFKQPPWTLW